MSANTAIEWTDHTFNVAWGCMKVSPGCQHCYADTLSRRYGHDVWGPAATTARRTFGEKHWAEPLKWNAKAEQEGVRRRVFCSSMCDVFEDHPTITAERAKLWPLIRATPWLDWQLLTKRPERIAANLPADWGEGYRNVWLGTSIESDEYVGRYDELRAVPALVHFLSLEPLLSEVNLYDRFMGLAPEEVWWVIVGGESGPGARAMELDWVRDILRACNEFGVHFFLKQLGGHPDKRGHEKAVLDGVRYVEMPGEVGRMIADDPLAPVISRTMLLLSNALRAARANDHAPVLENLCELHTLFGQLGEGHTKDLDYVAKAERKESERTTQLIEARLTIERLTREREHVRAMLYSLLGETSQVCRTLTTEPRVAAGV